MAGEMEEPFSLSFQADSLHSGSISFGRFEGESLSWERRSSFSHNRYLEEVEKCSKPGSVTAKKAYFEAHFRKKALLLQSSSEYQNGQHYRSSENDMSDNMDYREEIEHVNDENNHLDYFDESPDGSDYHGEPQEMNFEGEDTEISYSGSQMEAASCDADNVIGRSLNRVKPGDAHQTESKCEKSLLVDSEPDTEVNQKLLTEAVNAIDLSPKSTKSAKDDSSSSEGQLNPVSKQKAMCAMKPSKTMVKSQMLRKVSSEAPKDSVRNLSRRGVSSQRMKAEKQLSQISISAECSICKTLREADSESNKAKFLYVNKSENGLRSKKGVVPQPSMPEKVGASEHQIVNRSKRTVNSAKYDIKQNTAAFNFKSDERAQRRKEFYMRLEVKMHAKETEMNQIQARTQEKAEAEIKQFRRSLNFKATPMPSFYHEVLPKGSDVKKAASACTKSTKLQRKSGPGSKAAAGIPSSPNAHNGKFLSANDSGHTNDHPQASRSTSCPSAEFSESSVISVAAADRIRHSHVGTKIEAAGKERERKDFKSHKHRPSEGTKVTEGQQPGGKQKMKPGHDMHTMVEPSGLRKVNLTERPKNRLCISAFSWYILI